MINQVQHFGMAKQIKLQEEHRQIDQLTFGEFKLILDYNIMRNSFDITANPNLKGLSCILPSLPQLPPRCILKLTQSQSHIYIQYSKPELPSSIPLLSAQLPQKLVRLNGLKDGPTQYELEWNVSECKKLTIYVSKLDWQIINNKVHMLEQQFMNQVQVVWNGAMLPIYYDVNNCVVIRVQTSQAVGLLVENSEIEVLVESDQIQQNQNNQQRQYQCQDVAVLPAFLVAPGNINKVFIVKNHQMFAVNNLDRKQVQNNVEKIESKQSTSSKNKQSTVCANNMNEKYIFRVRYSEALTKQEQERTFPCDTDKVNIKSQIAQIKNVSLKTTKEKKKQSMQNLVVEVEVIDSLQILQTKCKQLTGKPMEIHHCMQDASTNLQESIQNVSSSHISDRSSKQKQMHENQPRPLYRATTPTDPQPEKQICNMVIINEHLVQNWGMDISQNIVLERIPRTEEGGASKKLDYLLNLKGLQVEITVAEKLDDDAEKLKQLFVQQIMGKLHQNYQGQQNGNITIYSKIPYLLLSEPTPRLCYVKLTQSGNDLSDPLKIIHAHKPKQPENMIKDKTRERQQAEDDVLRLKHKLNDVTKVNNIYYEDQSQEDIRTKVGVLNRANALAYKYQKQFIPKREVDQKDSEQMFISLYKVCYEQEITKVIEYVKTGVKQIESLEEQPLPLLLTSFANNGKTIMNKIIRSEQLNSIYIDMSQMDDTSHNLADLSLYCELVFQLSPHCIVFMDNLDAVCYKIDQGDLHRRQERIASKLIIRKISKYAKMYNKLCIFTAKNQHNIDEQFTQFEHIKLKNPSRDLRMKILSMHTQTTPTKLTQQEMNSIVQGSESMSFGQFSKYVMTDHKQEETNAREAGQPVIDFSKLAGIKEAKKILKGVVERPLKYSFVFKNLPIKLSRGVLLYGGSGTGKSAIGEALAGEFKMKFFSVKGSDILSKYIGGSQAAVRQVFQKAMSVSPSIIFFDEFESITPRRNASNTGVTDRVVNQFLTYLDGVASVEGVYIVAASSRPELIDPALLRPGRIDTHIFLDYPNVEDRHELLHLYRNSISFETELDELVEMTEGYSFSDLIGLIKQLRIKQSAKVIKQSNMNSAHETKVDSKLFKHITKQFLATIMSEYRVALTKQQKARQRERLLKFKNGDVPDVSKQKTIQK